MRAVDPFDEASASIACACGLKDHVEDAGKDLIITGDDGSVLVLKGVGLDDLGKDNFMF